MKKRILLLAAFAAGALGMRAQKANLTTDKGWENVKELPGDVNKYFFALYDHTEDLGLVMDKGVHQGTDKNAMWYKAEVDPENDKNALWAFTQVDDYQVIFNANYSGYFFQTEWNASWNFHTSDNGGASIAMDWGYVKPAYTIEEAWTLLNVKSGNLYLGPWENGQFAANTEIAGNKSGVDGAAIGHFDIFAITRGQYVQNAENLASVSATNPLDLTYTLSNTSATFHMTGWTQENASPLSNGYTFQHQNNGKLANSEGAWFFESWQDKNTLSDRKMYQTIVDLPAGVYKLTVLTDAAATGAFLYANNEQVDLSTNVNGVATVVVTLEENENLEIGVELKDYQSGWIKFDNFQLYYYGDTEFATDYTALNEAIAQAETYTLGFEEGEYAPYTNAEYIKALAAAKAIDTTAQNVKGEVDAIVKALTDVLENMQVNTEEVNAFYDGSFANATISETSANDMKLTGWPQTDQFRQVLGTVETHPGLVVADAQKAVFSWSGGGAYGAETGYEMPLKANTVYTLKFKVATWNGETDGDIRVSILNASDGSGMKEYNLGKAKHDIDGKNRESGMTSKEIVFATGTAGNYIFTINSPNNFVFTDLDLRKAESQVLEFEGGKEVAYAPGTYPTVKINRELTADRWATAVYPFAVNGVTVATLKDLTDGVLSFETAEASKANVPFLMKSAEGMEAITLNNVAVSAKGAQDATVEAGNVTLKGTYTATTVKADETEAYVYYVLSNNQLHKIGAINAEVPAYRAWIEIAADALSSEAGLRIAFDDGEATAIEAVVEQNGVNDGKIYDLSGRAVSAPTRGLYIINGKKVMVK